MWATIGYEPWLILLLVLANGAFAMSELAIVSARKARLQQKANDGDAKAITALALANHPNDFLSTVQVGITLIGTLAGAFGGATIANKLAVSLKNVAALAAHAETISMVVVVGAISYLSLILGELVPKRIALNNPEAIARTVAQPMRFLAKVASPAVRFLTWSSNLVIRILPLGAAPQAAVTPEEVNVLMQQGAEAGDFEAAEKSMVEGVFRLGDRRAAELMTLRRDVVFLNVSDDEAAVRRKTGAHPHSRFPVVQDNQLDRVIGVVHVKDLYGMTGNFDIRAAIKKPVYVPESMPALKVLDLFRNSGMHFALVVNEHGGVQGILTLTDLLEAVVGNLPDPGDIPSSRITPRDERSWIVDGALTADELKQWLKLQILPGEQEAGFKTVGGLLMHNLAKVPSVGDSLQFGGFESKVVEMEGNRVNKVLIRRIDD